METKRVSGVNAGDPGPQRVVEEAERRFLQHGFSRVTLDELARDLGMSKKTLYRWFPGKEALLRAVVMRFQQEIRDALDRIRSDADLDFVEKLSRMMTFLARHLSLVSPTAMADMRRSAPAVWKKVEEFRRQAILERFGALLKEGMRRGYFRKDLDSSELALLVYMEAIQQVLTPERLGQLNLTPEQGFRTLINILLGGLLTDKGRAGFKLSATGQGM